MIPEPAKAPRGGTRRSGSSHLIVKLRLQSQGPRSDVDIALVVRSQAVADQVREALMTLEDGQQIRVSLTALTAKDLAPLPEDDPWWANVAREGRVLKGAAPDQARRRPMKAVA